MWYGFFDFCEMSSASYMNPINWEYAITQEHRLTKARHQEVFNRWQYSTRNKPAQAHMSNHPTKIQPWITFEISSGSVPPLYTQPSSQWQLCRPRGLDFLLSMLWSFDSLASVCQTWFKERTWTRWYCEELDKFTSCNGRKALKCSAARWARFM